MSEPVSVPRSWIVVALLLHLLPAAMRPALIGGDEPHYALMAHSIAADGDVELADDYSEVEAGSNAAGRKRAGQALDRHLRLVGEREVFSHPLGLPLLLAPLLFVFERVAPGSAPDLLLISCTLALTFAALLAGWRLVIRWTGDLRQGTALALGVYFSTPLWYYSRTFFTEPYTWALAVLALAALASRRFALASLCLGLTLMMKETAALVVGPILVACGALQGWRRSLVVSIGPALFVLYFLTKNLVLIGEPLATFQPFQLGDPIRGALGLLADPATGLLWFAPLTILAAAGWMLRPRTPLESWLTATALVVFASYFALTAAWVDWRGGSCYGPRLLVPALPAFVLPLHLLRSRFPLRPVRLASAALFTLGFTVNWCAALHPFQAFWGASVTELVTVRPLDLVAGVILGALFVHSVERRRPVPRAGSGPEPV